MNLREQLKESWAHSRAARQVWILTPTPVPAYTWHELKSGHGTR
jgi:hypothetical protein